WSRRPYRAVRSTRPRRPCFRMPQAGVRPTPTDHNDRRPTSRNTQKFGMNVRRGPVAAHRTYSVRVQGQMPKVVVCDRLVESETDLEFWIDERDVPLLALRVPRENATWQLVSNKGRKPGVRSSISLRGARNALRAARRLIK